MMSDSRPEDRKNTGDNVFQGIPVSGNEPALFAQFLDAHDLAINSRKAFANDMRKFGQWFTSANKEPLCMAQILGHENLNTTSRYAKRTQDQLGAASDRLSY